MGISSTLSSGMTVPLTAPLTSVFPDQRPAPSGGATDPHFDKVSLLIHSDEAAESQTFNDSSYWNHTITPVGDVKHTDGSFHFAPTSITYDGTGDYLSVADSEAWHFADGDWTIEMWLKLDSTGVSDNLYTQRNTTSNRFNFQIDPNVMSFFVISGGSTVCSYSYTGTDALLGTDFNHLALVRSGTNIYWFVNGVSQTLSVSTAIGTQSLPNIAAALVLGARGDGGSNFLAGDRQELRVTKGAARYTENFTSPTEKFPSEGAAACYETVYDGVDDSFKSTDASLEISGEQTYEFECYIGSDAGHHYILNSRATVTGEGGLYFTYHDSGALQFFCTLFSTTGTGYRQAFLKTLPSPTLNWKKVVIVSSSSSLDFYIDGVAADVFAGTGSFTMGTPDNGITLGGDNFGGDFANVRTRKFAMHSGAATNAQDYSSGVDDTLLGVTEVGRSNDGGTTWETGQSFTESGDPTRQLCT